MSLTHPSHPSRLNKDSVDSRSRKGQDRGTPGAGATPSTPMSQPMTDSFRALRAAALTEPAFVRGPNGWLDTSSRRWLHWACAHAREIIGGVVGTPIGLAPAATTLPSPNPSDVPYLIRVSVGGAPLTIGLDLAAARSLVDTLTTALGGLRGTGPLSDGEQGILEFVLLESLERMIKRLDAPPGAVIVESLLPKDWAGPSQASHTLNLELLVGSSRGRVFVSEVPESIGQPDQSTAIRQPMENGVIALGLALPPIPLSETELARVTPGDLLLLSTVEPGGPWRVAHVVTPSGWCVARVDEIALGPDAATARLLEFEPCPHPPLRPDAPPSVLPVVGRSSASTSALARLAPSAMMDFEIDAEAPVRLWVEGAPIGTGELVKADGHAAVRVLSWNRNHSTI